MGAIAWGSVAMLVFAVFSTWLAAGFKWAVACLLFCAVMFVFACRASNDPIRKG